METPDSQESLLESFRAIISCSREEALFFFESHGWLLDAALHSYYEDDDSTPLTGGDDQGRGIAGDAEDLIPPPRQRSALPPRFSARSVGDMSSSLGLKDKKPAQPSGSRLTIHTLADLNRSSVPGSDDDSDEPQEYYTGGEKSGMLVQDPSKAARGFSQTIHWCSYLEFAIKHLFEAECKLCAEVLERAGPPDVAASCFADIAAQGGMPAFLQFGRIVTESKKDPIKLLKLLDIFATLNRLRPDFNRLFGGKACVEIQNLTRDLIKRVINGACEIFWELLTQVELQRGMPPPADGGVPRLVSFITDYCNRLLGEEYCPVLTQVLVIHRSWKQEKF